MNSFNCIKNKINHIISRSSVPEDPIHSINTLKWVLTIKSDADEAMHIAALGHDIDRALNKGKTLQKDYPDYDSFKQAHAINSAKILKEIMIDCQANESVINDVVFLVEHHEVGGSVRADIIKNADSLSYFDVNLPLFFMRHSIEETRQRCIWGYKRLSKDMVNHLRKFTYKEKALQEIMDDCLNLETASPG